MPAKTNLDMRVFVVGCERSGTTLVRTMLDMHPLLAVPPESYFVLKWLRQPELVMRNGRPDVDMATKQLGREGHFSRWGLPVEDVARRWHERPPDTLPELIYGVHAVYAEREGKPFVGDKTPFYVSGMPTLAAAFPSARFLHIVRDGRDTALSLLDRTYRPPYTLSGAAIFWQRRLAAGLAGSRRLGDGRFTEIRYEDLLDDPEGVLRKVCTFLGLDYDPCLLDYQERADRAAAGFRNPGLHRNLAKPPTKGIRDWCQVLSPRDQELFDGLAGDMLERYGYPRRAPGVPAGGPLLRPRVAGARIRWWAGTRSRRWRHRLRDASLAARAVVGRRRSA